MAQALGKPCKRITARILERESVIRLSPQDAHKILALLDHPPKPNQRLIDAVKTSRAALAQ